MMICSSSPGDPPPTLSTSSSAASHQYPDTPGTIERRPINKTHLPPIHDGSSWQHEDEQDVELKLGSHPGTAAVRQGNNNNTDRTASSSASALPDYSTLHDPHARAYGDPKAASTELSRSASHPSPAVSSPGSGTGGPSSLFSSPVASKKQTSLATRSLAADLSYSSLEARPLASRRKSDVGLALPNRPSSEGRRASAGGGAGPVLPQDDDVFTASSRKRERSLASQWDEKTHLARRRSAIEQDKPSLSTLADVAEPVTPTDLTFSLGPQQEVVGQSFGSAIDRRGSFSSSPVDGDHLGARTKTTPPQGMVEDMGTTIRGLSSGPSRPVLRIDSSMVIDESHVDGSDEGRSGLQTSQSWHDGLAQLADTSRGAAEQAHVLDQTGPIQRAHSFPGVSSFHLDHHQAHAHVLAAQSMSSLGQEAGPSPYLDQQNQQHQSDEGSHDLLFDGMDVDGMGAENTHMVDHGGAVHNVQPAYRSLPASGLARQQQPQQGGSFRSFFEGPSQHQIVYRHLPDAPHLIPHSQIVGALCSPPDAYAEDDSAPDVPHRDNTPAEGAPALISAFVFEQQVISQSGQYQPLPMSASSSAQSFQMSQQEEPSYPSGPPFGGDNVLTEGHGRPLSSVALQHQEFAYVIASHGDRQIGGDLVDPTQGLVHSSAHSHGTTRMNRFHTGPAPSDGSVAQTYQLQHQQEQNPFVDRMVTSGHGFVPQQNQHPGQQQHQHQHSLRHDGLLPGFQPSLPQLPQLLVDGNAPRSPTPAGSPDSPSPKPSMAAPNRQMRAPTESLEVPGRNHRRFSLPNAAQADELRLLMPGLSPPPNFVVTDPVKIAERAKKVRRARMEDHENSGRGEKYGQVGRYGKYALTTPKFPYTLKEEETFDHVALELALVGYDPDQKVNAFAISGGAGMPRKDCPFPGCNKTFKHGGKARQNHIDSHKAKEEQIGEVGSPTSASAFAAAKASMAAEKRAPSQRAAKSRGRAAKRHSDDDDETDDDMYSDRGGDDDADYGVDVKADIKFGRPQGR